LKLKILRASRFTGQLSGVRAILKFPFPFAHKCCKVSLSRKISLSEEYRLVKGYHNFRKADIMRLVSFPHSDNCSVLEITLVTISCVPENVLYACLTFIEETYFTYCFNPKKTHAMSFSSSIGKSKLKDLSDMVTITSFGSSISSSTFLSVHLPKFFRTDVFITKTPHTSFCFSCFFFCLTICEPDEIYL
jgi:hypothetical protein